MAENDEGMPKQRLQFPPTPEHRKLDGREEEHQGIVSFLNWCEETGRHVGRYVEEGGTVDFRTETPRDLVAEYFEIDTKAWEAEDRAVLEYARSL